MELSARERRQFQGAIQRVADRMIAAGIGGSNLQVQQRIENLYTAVDKLVTVAREQGFVVEWEQG